MKFISSRNLAVLAGLAAVGASYAAITIDGSMNEAEYGSPFAIQENTTGFGNNDLNFNPFATGSELDQLFAAADNDNLYIGMAGNLESNYNTFLLFFDSKAGGQNELLPGQPDVDFGYLDSFTNTSGAGFIFDAGFDADYAISMKGGDSGGGIYAMFVNYMKVGVDLGFPDGGGYLGTAGHPNVGGSLTGGDITDPVKVTIDNSNVDGVNSDSIADGSGVTTGAEWAIPLYMLGGQKADIKILGAVAGSSGYLSNQLLPSLPVGTANLTFGAGQDLNSYAGRQYIWLFPSVKGTLTVNGWSVDYSTVEAEFIDANSNVVATTVATVDAAGNFTVAGPIRGGNYTVRLRSQHSLFKAFDVDTTNGGVTGVNLSLVNGDVDGDNEVAPNDFSILSGAFGNVEGDPGFNANADLDGDGEVGPSDFSLLASAFGETGD